MGYCLSCGRLRDTVNGKCRQCNEDDLMRKHPGWKTKREVLEEQRRQQAKEGGYYVYLDVRKCYPSIKKPRSL